jgi:hypothetical protein
MKQPTGGETATYMSGSHEAGEVGIRFHSDIVGSWLIATFTLYNHKQFVESRSQEGRCCTAISHEG